MQSVLLEQVVDTNRNANLAVLARCCTEAHLGACVTRVTSTRQVGLVSNGVARAIAGQRALVASVINVSVEVRTLRQRVGSTDDGQLSLAAVVALHAKAISMGFVPSSGDAQCRGDVPAAAQPCILLGSLATDIAILAFMLVTTSNMSWA